MWVCVVKTLRVQIFFVTVLPASKATWSSPNISAFQDENRALRTEVDTLREELANQEAEQKENYKNAQRKSHDVMNDIKENEFRYWICLYLSIYRRVGE